MFPPDFSEDDVRIAVEIGTNAVRKLHELSKETATREELSEAVRSAFDSQLQKQVQTLQTELADARATAGAAAKLEKRAEELHGAMLSAQKQVERHREESEERERALARDCERARAAAQTGEREVQELRTRLLEYTTVSKCIGEVGEANVAEALEDHGIFTRRVGGNDAHHGHYHDLLCSLSPLRRADGRSYPMYTTDGGGERLSVEVKHHKGSNKLSAELEKFVERRALMVSEDSADCFLFVATASIPGQQYRSTIQIQRFEQRLVMTALIGAADVKSEEIALTSRLLLSAQERVAALRRPPIDDAKVEAVSSWCEELLGRMKDDLQRADETLRLAEAMVTHAKTSRFELLQSLLIHFNTLTTQGFIDVGAETQDVADALDVARSDAKKPTTCKVIRYNAELKRLRLHFGDEVHAKRSPRR